MRTIPYKLCEKKVTLDLKVDDNEIYYWQGIKFREGREGREGFSTYSNITNLDIGSNTHPTLPSFPNSPIMSDKSNIMEEIFKK